MSRNMYVTGSFQAASATAKKRDESIICVVAWGRPLRLPSLGKEEYVQCVWRTLGFMTSGTSA